MLNKDFPEPSDCVAVRYLIAGIDSAERRKRTTVDDLVHRRHVRQIIQVLQYVDPKHQFQVIGLVSALSFVIVRLYFLYPFASWHQSVHLHKKFLLARSDFGQFVRPERHRHLLIHGSIIPYLRLLCYHPQPLCGVALDNYSMSQWSDWEAVFVYEGNILLPQLIREFQAAY